MYILILFFTLSSFPVLLLDNEYLKFNSWIFYSFQFFVYSFYILNKIKYITFFFLPSSVSFFFLGLSFSIGSYYVPLNYGFLNEFYLFQYSNVKNFPVIVFFYMNLFNVLFLVLCNSLSKQKQFSGILFFYNSNKFALRAFLLVLLLIFCSIHETFFKFGAQVVIVSYLCFLLMKKNTFIKIFVYFLLILIILAFNHESKREILIILFILVFFISSELKLKFEFYSFKMFSYFFLIFLVFLLIIAASILRGYGNFEIEFFWQAIFFIPEYFKLDSITHILLDNFEISHTYPASILAVEYVLSGNIDLYYGLTVIKPIFLVVPRELWESKPDSIIAIFTDSHLSGLFDTGLSLPVSLPGELFINFSALSLFCMYLILFLADRLFFFSINKNTFSFKVVLSICSFITFFMLVRGSGFDLYILTILTSAIFAFASSIIVYFPNYFGRKYESRNSNKPNT